MAAFDSGVASGYTVNLDTSGLYGLLGYAEHLIRRWVMAEPLDMRHIAHGWEIPTENYSDQPYIVQADDGAWVCVVTTGTGREGERGQHVVTLRSTDQGQTWSDPVDVEPASGPEASYAVLLKVPGGRLYCFYNHNTDNVRAVKADDPPYTGGLSRRVDSQGYFVFKFSDDHGRSWSAERTPIPVREMAIDRENPYAGEIRYFWNVGRPFIHAGAAYVSLHKVGGLGHGFFTRSEGVLLKSEDILTKDDPTQITWETLPDGDAGLRTPPGGGPVAEEQSYCVLSDGSFYAVYRTIDGHPACAYSRDGGHTWTEPAYQRYADGRPMKHPRAATFAWRCANGKYIYWYHNHGGTWYEDRNPVWLCGGVEADTSEGKVILWSQPEIVLYDDDPYVRISYPDMVEEEGELFLSETQKDVARVHKVDRALLDGLWGQFEPDASRVTDDGLILQALAGEGCALDAIELPALPIFNERDETRPDYGSRDLRAGFTVETWLRFEALRAGQIVLDSRQPNGQGLCLLMRERERLEIVLNDGRSECRWASDPGLFDIGGTHHVGIVVDGGPKVITFVVDGQVNDGCGFRQFGWGRFGPYLRHADGEDRLRIGPSLEGEVLRLRLYDRALRVSELIANFRALEAGG
jgi:hypothetical protein